MIAPFRQRLTLSRETERQRRFPGLRPRRKPLYYGYGQIETPQQYFDLVDQKIAAWKKELSKYFPAEAVPEKEKRLDQDHKIVMDAYYATLKKAGLKELEKAVEYNSKWHVFYSFASGALSVAVKKAGESIAEKAKRALAGIGTGTLLVGAGLLAFMWLSRK